MSVHQESLEITRPVEREKAPELEYNTVRNDSLTMFGAAIGGAVLGMLLTLLVLAVVNGGTLNFTGGQRLTELEARYTRLDENVGAVSQNVDIVAQQARTLQAQVATVESGLGQDVATLETAVDELGRTSTQFTTFLTALESALAEATQAIEEPAP
jgi:hypothetical protein